MDLYELAKFTQLAIAHKCSLLFFTKDKFSNLGKKLRPEFEKLYLSSELKDCIKLLSTAITDGSEQHNAVDLVLADYDPGAVRLIDFINKRASSQQAKGCPIIPTIVIIYENNEREALEHLKVAGGVTKIIRHPFCTKDLLYTILDVVTTQKKVEETFRSQTKKKIISSKYPYMPIFDNPSAAVTDTNDPDQQPTHKEGMDRTTARRTLLRASHEHESVRSGTVSGSVGYHSGTHEQRVEEVEDGTDCSSLLPEFVTRLRKQQPELNSPYRQERLREARDGDGNSEEDKLQAEAAERVAWRARLASREAHGDDGSLDSSLEGGPDDILTKEDQMNLMDAKMLGSIDPLVDAFNYSAASLDKSSIASMVRKHQRAEETGAFSVGSPTTATPQNKIQELLSSSMRPVWMDTKLDADGNPAKVEVLAKNRNEGGKRTYAHVQDIRPFVNKPPPLVQRPSTVGGLDKRSADNYWRAYKPHKGDVSRKSEHKSLHHTESGYDLPTIGQHHGGPHRSGTAKLFTALNTPSHKTTTGGGHGSGLGSSSDLSQQLAQFGMTEAGGVHRSHAAMETIFSGASGEVVGAGMGTMPPSPSERVMRRSSHASLSMSTAGQSHTSREYGGGSTIQQITPSKAEKRISDMANEVAPDLQVSVLTEIDFSNRKINLGEKEMLMKGLRLEGDGDLDAAVSCYARAGMHSKDPHISKMLVGNLYYKNSKLILALNFYTQAAHLLSTRASSNRLVLDEFITYRNRGIINFRLGDDQSGLHDLNRAVELMPQDIELRELISLAKRRMGRYAQAIQEANVAKTIRNERRRQELIVEKQKDVLRKKKIIKAEKERNVQKIAGAVVYNTSAKFTQFASRSSRHSVMQRPGSAPAGMSPGSESRGMLDTQQSNNLFTDSSTAKDEDINTRLLQTRGYVLHIDEPKCINSLRDRVQESRKNMKANVDTDQQSSEDTYLRVFKMNNGYKADLFQDIFERPSELQEALLVHPEHRTPANLEVIATSLKLIPLLARLSGSVITDLARAIEYRALTTKDVIFSQGDQSCATCFLLSGHVQVKMEKQSAGHSTIDINIGEVPVYTTFGHIDFLFRNNNARIMQEVEKVIRPRPVRAKRIAATAAAGNAAWQLNPGGNNNSNHVKGSGGGGGGMVPHTASIEEGDEEGDEDSTVDQDIITPMLHIAGRGGHVDRSLAPGMFKTYAIQSMCELLILRENDFEKLLLQPTLEDLKRRLDAIRSCGIFNDWTPAQHVRLARMGLIKRVRKGDTILAQGHKPNFLYIILKGICVVQKQPNRTEMLVQKLTTAREKARAFDARYIFDHTLVTTLRMANLKEEFKAANADIPEVAYTLADAKRNPDSILRRHHVTASELERYKLQLEINKLEGMIASAASEDAREQDNATTTNTTGLGGSRKHNSSANNLAAAAASAAAAVNSASSNGAPVLELKVANIATIQWPKIFGEACITDPENGRSRGSVVADTACEIFLLHKAQIQTFPVDDAFLSSVKIKAVAYPGDPEVVISLYRKQEWKKYRAEVLGEIPKTHWLSGDEGVVKEPFRIS